MMKVIKANRNNKEGDIRMKIKVEKIIEKYGMDYITAGNLDVGRITEILEGAMHLPGRCICLDKEQDIYTNDLPLEECESTLSRIFGMSEK